MTDITLPRTELEQALKALGIVRLHYGKNQTVNVAFDALRERLAQPEQEPEYKGWYCAHCQRGVDGSEVTYNEQHTVCGRVITDDVSPRITLAQPAPPPEQEPVVWVKEDVCKGQYIDGRPRKIWWECGKGVGTAFYTTPQQRKKLPPQTPCLLTQAENKMFRLGWLECEAAHGIKGEA